MIVAMPLTPPLAILAGRINVAIAKPARQVPMSIYRISVTERFTCMCFHPPGDYFRYFSRVLRIAPLEETSSVKYVSTREAIPFA
jgi:hypothetical protein